LWPSREEIQHLENTIIKPEIYLNTYSKLTLGTERWNSLSVSKSFHFGWNENSTYIHDPPFFKSVERELPKLKPIINSYILAIFGDSITTDHISPAGNIAGNSPAARFLKAKGIEKKDFNTYGARRGNDLIMARGTFANIRISNKMLNGMVGPQAIHVPTG
jgi:aconitate hydratase